VSPLERKSASERREDILVASMDLFARHGLHGVTTRMIADAVGVSEALLYKHFKGKEELYDELQQWCMRDTMNVAERMAQLESGTQTLVLAIYFMTRQILASSEGEKRASCIKRLMLASLMDDGDFARGMLKRNTGRFIPKLVECLEAARKAGDLADKGRHPDVRVWLAHHVAVMASNMLLPARAVVDYGMGGDALAEEIARFSLRGLGLTEEALARHFAPKALAAFASRLAHETTQSKQTTTYQTASGQEGSRR
jgi:AcrR family transcriptional regulator